MHTIHHGLAEDCYDSWPTPTCIISDGPYGIGGYEGDPKTPKSLPQWYAGHVAAWGQACIQRHDSLVLGNGISWANVHPVMEQHGWMYHSCCIWDKGMGHVAGNANTKTLTKFPVVTEICVQYVRKPIFVRNGEIFSLQGLASRRMEKIWFGDARGKCGMRLQKRSQSKISGKRLAMVSPTGRNADPPVRIRQRTWRAFWSALLPL